ncbi:MULTISPECIES: hypothetical protein [Moorena]|uniref:Uncharacterized protein n=1 Tax=Moorena producens 3L TaxID=489825 RepID=F4XIC6_9CYAN|nr:MULTISPECIES: hypothetical protein [Moorena]NES81831.1 hypothetical protein [Moorena sp. SIO2B7]EGJ35659.1 hypothetical protein LYNGBM3L_01240 [Moorena producens 3L]NEP34389.1 hypothetical protein [Moorena sp. SIO3B2]NEP66672.1 hypothetical protein [Moorena sp. SIO3A5]NEQ05454.1 hypothetical protein [Moorena sp. SIO4E2]
MDLYRRLLWSTILVFSSLVTQIPTASAEIKEYHVILNSDSSQSFERLIQQTENLAQTKLNQEFTGNPDITSISMMILGERNGQVVPLMIATVSRSQWKQFPIIQRWASYFSNSEMLLGFRASDSSPAPSNPPKSSVLLEASLEDDPGFRDD